LTWQDSCALVNRQDQDQVQHLRTKHIEIRHHFIRDHVSNEDYEIYFVATESQLANIFTKLLSKGRLYSLINELGRIDLQALS